MLNPRVQQKALQEMWFRPYDTEVKGLAFCLPRCDQGYKTEKQWKHLRSWPHGPEAAGGKRGTRAAAGWRTRHRPRCSHPCPSMVRDSRTPKPDVGTGRLHLSSTRRLAEEKHWEKTMRTRGQIWWFDSSENSFPLLKKETKEMPSVDLLFLLENSLFFWETSLCGSCLN